MVSGRIEITASTTNMLFLNQKFFLDVKDYSRIDRLEADIRQLGGIIEKFLSKEITCVVTNRTRTENLLPHKDASTSTANQSQSHRPSACGDRVMSRGQRLLMRSNSLKDTSVRDPVAFAQTWDIKIVTLDTVVKAIDRQLQTCNPSSPVSKQSAESQHVTKRRKYSGTCEKGDAKSNFRQFLTKFSGAFVKFEDTESNFRPFYKQYSTFPHLDLEGDLSNGIFGSAENIRRVSAKKNVNTTPSARKQKAWSKRGYCECCDVMYDDLNQHLISVSHLRFAEHKENFADLDKLIDRICLFDDSSMLLPAEENRTCHVTCVCETASAECSHKIQLNNSNLSTVDVESATFRNVHLQQNQSHDCHSKREESDEVVNAVENWKENRSVYVEQTEKRNVGPTHASAKGVSALSVRLDDDDGIEKVSGSSHAETLPYHCDSENILSSSNTVAQSVYSCKANEASHNKKLGDISADRNASRDDDMPDYISSDYVINLLELLSSENSIHSSLPADKARYCTGENHSSVPPMNSMAFSCIPVECRYSTTRPEALPDEKEQQTVMTSVTDKCSFPLMSVPNHLLDSIGTSEATEPYTAVIDKCAIKSEQLSESVVLPANNMSTSPADVTLLSEISLITNSGRNYDDNRSCNMKVDSDASALPLCGVQNDSSSPPTLVDQPSVCTAAVRNKSAVPVYTHRQVHRDCMFDECGLSPAVSSDLMADGFELHDKLLTMAYELDTAEHNQPQSCSSTQASYSCSANSVDFSTSDNSNFCLPMAFSPTPCFSEDSAPPADCGDTGLCTPVHSGRDSFEKTASFATDNNTATECTSLYHSTPLSDTGIVSLVGSADVNDNFQSSLLYMGLPKNTEVNVVSDKANACLLQEKGDLPNSSSRSNTFEIESKPDVTASCASIHGFENFHESLSVDNMLVETTLMADDSSCCVPVKSFGSVSALPVSVCSSSLWPEFNSKCSVLRPESYVTEPKEEEGDLDNDSASTLVYSVDCTAASSPEHKVENESETPADHREPPVSSADSTWKVISFVDCQMRLVRTQAVLPALSTQTANKISGDLCVLGHKLHNTTESLEHTAGDSNNSMSFLVYNCDCPGASANGRIEMKSETRGDYREPFVSSTNNTWKVISFVDCRMRLVRSEADFPALPVHSASSTVDFGVR